MDHLKLPAALLWMLGYFAVMLGYTAVNVAVWRQLFPQAAPWLDLLTAAACSATFLWLMHARTGWSPRWTAGGAWTGLLLAAGCVLGFWLLLDCGLDPLLARLLPSCEDAYQEAVQSLLAAPISSFFKVAVLAPVVEELLTRSFLLGGLRDGYGTAAALLVSIAVFALLHFNMVQTLSAAVCGLALGLLYLKTGSVFCCILAHSGYNILSYLTMLWPHLSE